MLWMYLTPSMKLSELEMAIGMETLAPGLLILLFIAPKGIKFG